MNGRAFGKQRRTRRLRRGRGGYTLLELVISSSVGAVLVAGLSGSLYIASRSIESSDRSFDESSAQEILSTMMADLNQAIRFTVRTDTAVQFTVPDRTGDGLPEEIIYSWGGVAGTPLIYWYNGSAPVLLANDVQYFDLRYLTRMMTATGGGNAPIPAVVFEEFTEKKEGSNTTSLSLDLPGGTSEGDLLIACSAIDGDVVSSILAPAGWNAINVGQEQGEVTFGVLWKIAAASESSTMQITWSGGQEALGWIMRFTGHDASNPIDAMATAAGTSSSPTSPAVTTSLDNAMILRLGGFDNRSVTVGDTGLSGHTTIFMDMSGNGDGTVSGGAGYATLSTAGDSGTENFSLTDSEAYRAVTISIAPDPAN